MFLDANFNWTEKAENIKTMRSSSHRSSNRYTEYRIEYLILTLLANSSDFLERLSGPPGTSKLGKSEDKLILWKYFIRLPYEMYSSILLLINGIKWKIIGVKVSEGGMNGEWSGVRW